MLSHFTTAFSGFMANRRCLLCVLKQWVGKSKLTKSECYQHVVCQCQLDLCEYLLSNLHPVLFHRNAVVMLKLI